MVGNTNIFIYIYYFFCSAVGGGVAEDVTDRQGVQRGMSLCQDVAHVSLCFNIILTDM